MRVLMVGQFAKRRGENDGGVSAVMSYLADALLERPGIELIGARLGAAEGDVSSDQVLGFPIYNIPTTSRGLMSGFRRQRSCFNSIVSQAEPDIVHGQGVDLAGLLAIESGLPAIVTVHGIIGEDARYKSRLKDRIRESIASRLIEKPVIRRAKSLIVISPYVSEYYGNAIQGQIYQIPNPVGQDYFDVSPQPQPGRMLYAGRVIPRKGIVDLVHAIANLDRDLDPHLIIAGSLADRAYVDEVKSAIEKSGIGDRVHLVGLLRDAELLREFSKAQVLVLPSYQETAPMVVLQAMAAGIPVVASSICGIPYQVVDGQSGFMFQPGDIATLHRHLQRLLSSGSEAQAMGKAGRRIAIDTFHASSVAAATESAYRETIDDAENFQSCA